MGGLRASFNSRLPFTVLFLVALGLTIYVLWPFRVPLLLAAVLASVLYRIFLRLCRVAGGRRWLGALLTTFGLVLVLLGPLAAIVALATQQIIHGFAFVHDQLGIRSVSQLKPGSLPLRGQHFADHVLGALHVTIDQVRSLVGRASSLAEHATHEVLASSSKAVFHTAIMLITFYFLLLEGQVLVRWLRRLSPLEAHETGELLDEFRSVSRATILGAAITSLFQAVTATIGYVISRVPHPVFFGLLTLLASFVPLVGTPLVWVPAVILLWLFGHHLGAVVLTVWCVVLVIGAEHVAKPFVLRMILHSREPMHTGLVFLSLLGGIQMFGLIGVVLGPLVMALFLSMARMYERRIGADQHAHH